MAAKNTSSIKKSLGQYKRHSKTKIQDVNDFLKENAHLESLEDYRRDELLDLLKKLKVQVERYETCLDENSQHLIDEDATLEDDKPNAGQSVTDDTLTHLLHFTLSGSSLFVVNWIWRSCSLTV